MSVFFMAINMTLLDREMYPPAVPLLFPPTPTITCNFMSRSKITCEFQEDKPLIQMVQKTVEAAACLLSPLHSSQTNLIFISHLSCRKGHFEPAASPLTQPLHYFMPMSRSRQIRIQKVALLLVLLESLDLCFTLRLDLSHLQYVAMCCCMLQHLLFKTRQVVSGHKIEAPPAIMGVL